ncbi:hypothetical protein DNN94_23085 [Escherichia coli]|uniref:hypothetical protein n=1 Tax=Escherichia coli TaxID=562 RepID=UPI0015942512|nr:hypothetical protein [Escherichia coli]NVG84705.1 hypothetical protein [Escherichia coli]
MSTSKNISSLDTTSLSREGCEQICSQPLPQFMYQANFLPLFLLFLFPQLPELLGGAFEIDLNNFPCLVLKAGPLLRCLLVVIPASAHCGYSSPAGGGVGKSNKISSVGVNSKKIPMIAAITSKIPSCQLIC